MQYHEIMILLYRPLLAQNPLTAAPMPNLNGHFNGRIALETCTTSALQICGLLKIFQHRYKIDHIHVNVSHILTTAALILICNSRSFGYRAKECQGLTLACIQTLREISKTYPSAIRSLEVVTSLRREWQAWRENNSRP